LKSKILIVVNVDWFFVSHRLPIAIQAIKEGYEVHLSCCFTDKKEELRGMGLVLHEINFSRSGNGLLNEIKTLKNLRTVIKEVNPCLIHAVTIKAVLYSGLLINTLKQKPAFVAAISGLGYVFSAKSIRAKLTRFLVSILYRLSLRHVRVAVIFQNDIDEKVLTEIVGLPNEKKVKIRGSGADLQQYRAVPEHECSKICVVMACRLLKEKGVYEFVEAARLLKSDYYEFLLVGSIDPENPNTVQQHEIDEWNEEGIIKALGNRNDIPSIFAESHIVTLPSYYGEGVPKVLIEAAACGRPIVTTDNPGCRDAVIPSETGLLVPVKNAEDLAKAIQKLAENKVMRINMGVKARLFAEQEFDVKNVVEKHMDIYKELLNK
jgi:glycosyltransferase involved in cell wall biosynthesis